MLQLALFADLPIPPDALPFRRVAGHRAKPRDMQEQLAFVFRLRSLECDRDTDFDYPQHHLVRAGEAERPETTAPSSIFDLARRAAKALGNRRRKLPEAAALPPLKATIERSTSDGVVRNIGASYPARWTEEDFERERRRRAKQRPPKPTKKVRTMSEKLSAMITGEIDGDE